MDKIKVLLIDDKPLSLSLDYFFEDREYNLPIIHEHAGSDRKYPELNENFELRWIATAVEGREYRDLSRIISSLSPEKLGEVGWIPEILCFDYALSGDEEAVENRDYPEKLLKTLSPLPRLRDYAISNGLKIPFSESYPETGTPKNEDNMGCYVGGLIFTTFSDHPCAPVALTRKGIDKTENTEASFFEWMLELESNGTFKRKGRPLPFWHELLCEGVKTLRDRIKLLLIEKVIKVSFEDLMGIEEGGEQKYITVKSRYNTVRLPLNGLFMDVPSDNRGIIASEWARNLIKDTYSKLNFDFDDFVKGKKLSESLWSAYESDLCEKRYRLSELLQKQSQNLSQNEKIELNQLKFEFGVEVKTYKKKEVYYCTKKTVDIKTNNYNDRARRWAVLMIMVRLFFFYNEVKDIWLKICKAEDVSPYLPYGFNEPPTKRAITIAIYPIPGSTAIIKRLWDESENKDLLRLNISELKKSKRQDKHNYGNLALNINDVLYGYSWKEDESIPKKEWHYGLLPGERFILQLYANDIGFSEKSWPEWLRKERFNE